MEEAKRKQIEAQLRRLMASADNSADPSHPAGPRLPRTVQVIHRRSRRPNPSTNDSQKVSETAQADRG